MLVFFTEEGCFRVGPSALLHQSGDSIKKQSVLFAILATFCITGTMACSKKASVEKVQVIEKTPVIVHETPVIIHDAPPAGEAEKTGKKLDRVIGDVNDLGR
ncbi:MAG: hypothetical protein JWP91_2046 [Fibrobacteres bacterium]|nr:hypothetical protein [Fibrobacterota bacterium]